MTKEKPTNTKKELKVTLYNDVYNNVKSHIGLRKSMGNVYGVLDELIMLMIDAIEKGETEIEIVKAKKVKQND